MKFKIQFDEESRFSAPLPPARRSRAASLLRLEHRAWPSMASARSRLRQIEVKHGNVIKIPEGFQTETGCHFGVAPPEQKSVG